MPKDDDYEVGYGKPPRETQFRPGKSGNPRGRPKGSGGFKELFIKHLSKTVTVTIDGQKRRAPVKEAFVLSLMMSALNGTPDQKIKLARLMEPWLEQEEEPEPPYNYAALDDDELDLLEKLLMKAAWDAADQEA